ncbi:MAG TPA: hypothetical protein VIL69_22645 [Roseomonas sp.]|jgi:FSR family fosmidomycin resistance protein-like MFS transporter
MQGSQSRNEEFHKLPLKQELLPGRVGLVAWLFFDFSFGLGGLGAAALGEMAARVGIDAVYRICSFLPLLGVLTILLPNVERRRQAGNR